MNVQNSRICKYSCVVPHNSVLCRILLSNTSSDRIKSDIDIAVGQFEILFASTCFSSCSHSLMSDLFFPTFIAKSVHFPSAHWKSDFKIKAHKHNLWLSQTVWEPILAQYSANTSVMWMLEACSALRVDLWQWKSRKNLGKWTYFAYSGFFLMR